MGDFFTTPSGFREVPPEPDSPVPDFTTIAGNIGLGIDKSGTLNKLWNGLFETLFHWLTAILGWLLRQAFIIIAKVFSLFGDTTEEASLGYGTLVAVTLKDLFGITVDPATVNTRRGGDDRQEVANRLGQKIIGTLFAGVQADPTGGVKPSDAAANSFLAVMMNMELNGWVEAWFADAVSYHLLEKWGELKDGISRSLGLGRMSRQVFAAPIKVLVHDPYLELLYQKYRSKAPNVGTIVNAFFRGEIDETRLSVLLGNQGYTEQEIKWLVADHEKFLPLADVDYLLSRQQWSNDEAEQYLQTQGNTLAGAQRIIAILNDKRTYKYRQEMVQVAEASYVRGDMELGRFLQIVSLQDIPPEERAWISNVATLKRQCNVTHLSLGQIESGIIDGVLGFSDLQKWGERVNMPADELAFLELMIQFKVNKETASTHAKNAAAAAKATAAKAKSDAAAATAAIAKAQAPDKGISAAEAETLVKDGIWTFDRLTAFLTARQYGPDAIAAIVHLLHDQISAAAAGKTTVSGARATAAAKGLSLADAEKAVIDGVLSIDDLAKLLTVQGFDAADAEVVLELTRMAAADAKTKADAKAAATAKAATKQISLPEIERAVRAGLTTMQTYHAALTAAGFDPVSIALLEGLLTQQIAADQAAAAKAAAAAAGAAAKGITIAQLEQEVINGIKPIEAYTSALTAAGYGIDDRKDLTQLLQLKVDQAKATAAHRSAAGQQLAARDISITQAERAVKLGVLAIADYQAILKADNFSQHAIDVLTNTLLAEVAATAKAQTAANGAAVALAKKKISLPDLERAVIAGLQPIEAYSATLTAAGYSDADVSTLTQLLRLKIEQAEAAASAHADAEGAATERGISLGDEEQAVIDGLKTMANYDALLYRLGYDEVDRATLENLLSKRVNAAAAKAAKDAAAADDTASGG